MQAKTTRAQLSKREAIAIGVALVGIFIAVDVYVSMRKNVWFFNGTSSAYDVVIDGGKTMHLEPNVPQVVAIGLGNHTLTATVEGQPRELSFSSGIPALVAAFDVQKVHVVNPDGCGVLLTERRSWGGTGPSRTAFHGRLYYRLDADFVFTPFVGTVTKKQQSKIALTLPATPQAALDAIEAEGGPELVARHQQACARWSTP